MRCSNVLFVVFFLAIVVFQISKSVLGVWFTGIYLLIVLVTFLLFRHCLRNCVPGNDLPNLWPFFTDEVSSSLIADNGQSAAAAESLTICLVCSDLDCGKHDPELAVHLQPWKHLLVDTKVNAELELLFSSLLDQHTSWLKDISHNNEEILLELKRVIRMIAAALLLRIKRRLHWKEVVFKKLPKYFTHHLEMYLYGKRKAKSAKFLEESVLRQYGNLLHPAVVSAENEAKFLKSVANLIIHTTLPYKFTKCDVSHSFLIEFICGCILSPLIDILIDPDKINSFLIFFFDKTDISVNETDSLASPKVEFLSSLVDMKSKFAPDHLGIEKSQIFEDQHLLFLFTQFAKEEHFLNVLQFVMHMSTFISQITNPDLTEEDCKSLHQRLVNIYELYLLSSSKDYIQLDDVIKDTFAQAAHGPYGEVQQLRNSKALYEAFECTNEILDFHCHKFFHTDVYLKLICGQRSLSFNLAYEEYFQVKNGRQEKDSLEGGLEDNPLPGLPEEIKDLSTLKVAIVNINTKFDIVGRELFYFEIETTQVNDKKWLVERQFAEFFTLASKLKEFHGDELTDFLLPTRKFLRANKSLMESYRYDLELFLRDLLGNVYLKRSELVYNFLSAPEFSGYFTDNFNLGKMIKNVPAKFSKERGQHLYPFLRNFVLSCERSQSGQEDPAPETKERDAEEEQGGRRQRNSGGSRVDTESMDLSTAGTASVSTDRIHCHLEYLFDQVLLILIRFYSIPSWILQLLFMIRPLFRQTFQAVCEYFAGKQLQRSLLRPSKMSHLIGNLRRQLEHSERADDDVSSSSSSSVQSLPSLTKSQRSQKALKLATELVPRWMLERLVNYNQHEQFVFLLFSLLQHRMLNKQLLFLLVNSLLADLFPESIYQTID